MKETIINILIGHGIDICAYVLTILLGELIRRGIVYFREKTKLEVPAKIEAILIDIAEHSVNFANEKAHQFAKTQSAKLESGAKMEAALTFANHLIEEHGLKEVSKEKLAMYLESRLGAKR